MPIAKLSEQEDKSTVTIAGALTSVDKKFTKKDSKPFAIVIVEDLTDQLEVMIWSETYLKSQQHLLTGSVVTITGRLDLRDEGVRISANEIKPLKKPAPREKPVVLTFERERTTEADLVAVREALHSSPGTRRVEFVFVGGDGVPLRLVPHDDFRISWTEDVRQRLAPWLRA